jgi:hypothetical protein
MASCSLRSDGFDLGDYMPSRTPHILGVNHKCAQLLTRSALQRRIARALRAPPCVVVTTAFAKDGLQFPYFVSI